MEIEVPERMDILDLEAADLEAMGAAFGGLAARCAGVGTRSRLFDPPLGFHITPDGWVGRYGLLWGQESDEVVVVKPVGPTGMSLILCRQGLAK